MTANDDELLNILDDLENESQDDMESDIDSQVVSERDIDDVRKKIESQENEEKQRMNDMDNEPELSLVWTDSESSDAANEDEQEIMDIDNTKTNKSRSPSASVIYTQSVHKSARKQKRKIEKEIYDIIATQKEFEDQIESESIDDDDDDDDDDELILDLLISDIDDDDDDGDQSKPEKPNEEFIIPQYDGGDGNIQNESSINKLFYACFI